MMKETLSVIVPIYNVQNYLNQCIESILNQTYKELEIILVDDGSTDLSGSICDRFAQQDRRVKVIHKNNRGSICARYEGILQAKSKYITFVDGDDWIKADAYENLMEIIIKRNVDMIAAGYIVYWEEVDWKESRDDLFDPGEYDKKMIQENIIPRMMWNDERNTWPISSALWNKIFKRDILLKVYDGLKNYRFHYADDAAVVYPYILEVEKIYLTHECYYFYRQRKRGDVATYIQNDFFFEDLFDFFKYLKSIFEKNKYKDVLIKQLEYFYITTVQNRKLKYFDTNRKGFFHLFPFDKVEKGSKIIIYGAGRVGHEYYEQIKQLKYSQIVLWVDKNFDKYEQENVKDIKMILKVNYDHLIIANASELMTKIIIGELLDLGVPKNKIVSYLLRNEQGE